MSLYSRLFTYTNIIIYLLYVLTYFGLWNQSPVYLKYINYFFQLFIGLTLIYFYNPFFKHKYSNIHKQMVFTAGFLLLAGTSTEIFQSNIMGLYYQLKKDGFLLKYF